MANVTDTTFARVPLGGGGYVTEIDISSDGNTRIIKTDVSPGAYIWANPNNLVALDSTGLSTSFRWIPLMTPTSMAGTGYVQGNWGAGFNCHDVAFAPSNPAVIYMLAPGLAGTPSTYLFRSADRGRTFTKTLAPVTDSHSQGDDNRPYGHKSAVDPFDPNHYIWTTSDGKVYRTTDGGNNAVQIPTSSIPQGTIRSGTTTAPMCVAFDPTTSGTVYVHSYGNGLYKSVNGGVNWSAVASAPTTSRRMIVDGLGRLFLTTNANGANLYRLVGTTWTNLTVSWPDGWVGVAVNPLDTNEITVQSGGGNIDTSFNGGSTWVGAYDNAPIRVAGTGDVPWLADCNENYMTAGQIVYDAQNSRKLWFSMGIGVWHTTPPTGTFVRPTWVSCTRGNDELIVQHIMKPPGAGRKLIMTCQDRGVFALDGVNYPTTQYPRDYAIRHGGGCDYCAANPDFVVAAISGGASPPYEAAYQQLSGYSPDGGANWTKFGAAPSANWGGITLVSASDPNNLVFVPHSGSTGADARVKFSTNKGASWAESNFSGMTGSDGKPAGEVAVTHFTIKWVNACSDKTVGGIFYVYSIMSNGTGGLWKSTDGGANFARQSTRWAVDANGAPSKLTSVPGKAGHLFWSFGFGDVHPYNPGGNTYNTCFRFSANGGLTWTDLGSGWGEVWSFGPGKEKIVGGYPTLFVAGARFGENPGIYRCTDFNPASPMDATWDRLNVDYTTYDSFTFVTGDMEVYGDVWVGLGSSGVIRGTVAGGGGGGGPAPVIYNRVRPRGRKLRGIR